MTRHLFFSLTCIMLITLPGAAQVDMNALMKSAGMQVEPDNGPIVLNTFVGSLRLEMHQYSRNGQTAADEWKEEKTSPANMEYASNSQYTLVKMKSKEKEGQNFGMLTDHKAKVQYMLTQDAKGQKMAIKQRKTKVVVPDEKSDDDVVVKRMDEQRTILGHTCIKYVATAKDGQWTGWVAERMEAPFEDMMRQSSSSNDRMAEKMRLMPGFALEWEWISADGTERHVAYVRDLQMGEVDAKAFSLDGYTMMDMSNPASIR